MSDFVITTGLTVEGFDSGRICITFDYLTQDEFHKAPEGDDLEALAHKGKRYSFTPDQVHNLRDHLTRAIERMDEPEAPARDENVH